MSSFFTFLLKEETGATAVEYAVMLGFIIAACIGAVRGVGQKAADVWGSDSTGIAAYLNNP